MVEQAGSLAGFAAVIGLAVLSALYFSQARDLRRLREWAGRAPERAAELPPSGSPIPGRVAAVPQRQPQATAPGGQPAPAENAKADAAATSNGDAAPSVAAGKPADAAQADAEKPAVAGEQKEGEQAKDGEAGSKPGMPAPASAAAAGAAAAAASAGAGAASATGPAAPSGSAAAPPASAPGSRGSGPAPGAQGSGSATPASPPGAQGSGSATTASPPPAGAPGAPRSTPQRTPGSVLPPRTGTLPPVRRLPSSQVGASPAQTGVLGQAPQKKKRNPLYVALAVIGVLVIGAAAAIGVPAIVNGTKKDNKTSSKAAAKTSTHRTRTSHAATTPSKITVAVLNGTSIPGLAAQIGDRVDADGFTLGTVSNASSAQGQRANSVAMYASGHESDAKLVAKKLGIKNVQAIDSSSQQIAGDATVVVIVGSDKTQ